MLDHLVACGGGCNGEQQPVLGNREMQLVRARVHTIDRKSVAIENVEDGDFALVLDIGAASPERLRVERNLRQAVASFFSGREGLIHAASARLCQTDFDGATVSLQPLSARQRHCRRSKCCERCCIKL